MNEFKIELFNPDEYPVLGKGAWGKVYDLQDGTVLKIGVISRDGTGDGAAKILRERDVMIKLMKDECISSLVPEYIDSGPVLSNQFLASSGYSLWLRSTKINGLCLKSDMFQNLPDVHRYAPDIGRALGVLHQALAGIYQTLGPRDDPYADVVPVIVDDGKYMEWWQELQRRRQEISEEIMSSPAHNDFNITNLIFDGYSVCGIVDFAECGTSYPEKDLSDIIRDFPDFTDAMMESYRDASGFKPDMSRIQLGVAENAFFAAIMWRSRKQFEKVNKWENILVRNLIP